jgi:REP element-mobilizing transposase RayT
MSQSLSQTWVHIIFSTKNREQLLPDRQVREKLYGYLAGICKQMKSPALIIGGVSDHVHILCNQSKNVALKDLIRNLKQESSKWIKREWPDLNYFYWQQGYGAFSVSPTHLEAVRQYIETQEEHHLKVGFQDEFRSFLQRYHVPFDERYVWD